MNAETAIAIKEAKRLPWDATIEQRFADLNVTESTWKVLVETVWPSALTTETVVMALAYCKARRLDPFKKPVHIVPVWDSKKGGMVETVWPSIAEMRTTAFRTGQYAGCDETVFGPTISKTFEGKVKRDNKWEDVKVTVEFPEWAQITIYRTLGGVARKFVGPKTYWLESYGQQAPSELPNRMWSRRSSGQLEKCAEAAALRKTFPEELGNEYAAEEMEGQRLYNGQTIEHEPVVPRTLTPPTEPTPPAATIAIKGDGKKKAPPPPGVKKKDPEPDPEQGKPEQEKPPVAGTMDKISAAMIVAEIQNCSTDAEIVAVQAKYAPKIIDLPSNGRDEVLHAIDAARKAIAATDDDFPGDR